MNSKKIIIFIAVLLGLNSYAQKSDTIIRKKLSCAFVKKNSVNFEAFGHGLYYSFSYERMLINKSRHKLSAQVGAAIYPTPSDFSLWVPFSINFVEALDEQRKHHLELGIGHVFRFDFLHFGTYTNQTWDRFATFKVGYRHQKINGKFVWKVLFTPFLIYSLKDSDNRDILRVYEFAPSGAISFGYLF